MRSKVKETINYLEREREKEKLPDNNAIPPSLAYIHNWIPKIPLLLYVKHHFNQTYFYQ